MNALPPEEGVTKRAEDQEAGLLRQQEFARRLVHLRSLHELSQDFAIFSHAAILLWGRLAADPVQTWYNSQTRSDMIVSPVRFDSRVVAGVGDWDNTLWLCERPVWDSLRRHLAGVGSWDQDSGQLRLSVQQDLVIEDPLIRQNWAVQPSVMPQVEITLFGLKTTEANWVWINGQRYATLTRRPPDGLVVSATTKYRQQGGI